MLSCIQLTRNVRFNWNMDNFKFNFLWRGQLGSLNLDRTFLPLFKILPCQEVFFGNLIFAIISRILCGSPLKFQRLLPLRRQSLQSIRNLLTFFYCLVAVSWRNVCYAELFAILSRLEASIFYLLSSYVLVKNCCFAVN